MSTIHRYIVAKHTEDQRIIDEMHTRYADELSDFHSSSKICILTWQNHVESIAKLSREAQTYLTKQKKHHPNDAIEVIINRDLLVQKLQAILNQKLRWFIYPNENSGQYGSLGTHRNIANIIIEKIPKAPPLSTYGRSSCAVAPIPLY